MFHEWSAGVPQKFGGQSYISGANGDMSPPPAAWCTLSIVINLMVCLDNLNALSVCHNRKKVENGWSEARGCYKVLCPQVPGGVATSLQVSVEVQFSVLKIRAAKDSVPSRPPT